MQACSFDHQGISVHHMEGGSGFPILMIHGSGPGASTQGNWRRVLEPLAREHHVFAMDLIGFGQSGRKPAPPYFDFPLWIEQCEAMMSRMPGERIGLIGHSISGSLALKLAARNPRVSHVMTTATVGAVFPLTDATLRTWTFPRTRDELRLAAQGLFHDTSLIDDAYLDGREAVLRSGDYESYFGTMFEGNKLRYIDQAVLSAQELAAIRCEVLMLHGRDDPGFPAEPLTLTVSRSIPHADVVLLGRCAHSVAYEHPDKFLALAGTFFPRPAA